MTERDRQSRILWAVIIIVGVAPGLAITLAIVLLMLFGGRFY